MNTKLSPFRRADAAGQKHLSNLLDKELGIYTESCFRELLILERKRTERSGIPFLMMLFDISAIVDHRFHKGKSNALKQVVAHSIRETDMAGWFEHESVIGVICMEAHAGSVGSIAEKYRSSLVRFLEPKDAGRVIITWFSFPDRTEDQEHQAAARTPYNEPAEAVPAEMAA